MTGADRVEIVAALSGSGIPDGLHEGLVRYFVDGILPGSFLQAVLSNELWQAVTRADPQSLDALPSLIEFLVIYVPASAWGSRVAVQTWISERRS